MVHAEEREISLEDTRAGHWDWKALMRLCVLGELIARECKSVTGMRVLGLLTFRG